MTVVRDNSRSLAQADLLLFPGCCSIHSRMRAASLLFSTVACLRPLPLRQNPSGSSNICNALALARCIYCFRPFRRFGMMRILVVRSMVDVGQWLYLASYAFMASMTSSLVKWLSSLSVFWSRRGTRARASRSTSSLGMSHLTAKMTSVRTHQYLWCTSAVPGSPLNLFSHQS